MSLALIGLPSDTYESHGLAFHSLGDKYIRAVQDVSGCLALMVPSMGDDLAMEDLLDTLDGILITGAVSNVHPPLYGETPTVDHEPYDHARDATTLKLIRAVVARGMPLFAICRGFQELNVAFGGTLETELQRKDGRLDHRGKSDTDAAARYAPSHTVAITPGGVLHGILGASSMMVNSVHRQGVKSLGKGLVAEAVAPDGIIESVSIAGAKGFTLGTQWHPEYQAADNPDSVKLFEAFGDAARAYHARRLGLLRQSA